MAKKTVSSIQVSDIVSVQTMNRIAQLVRTKAAEIARQKRAPLKSDHVPGQREGAGGNLYDPRLIGIKSPKTTQAQIVIDLTLSDVAMAFEYGMRPHTISARNYPYLFFPDSRTGEWVKKKSVKHPGFKNIKDRKFLAPAKEQTREERRRILKEEAGKNIRTIIRGMARVVK